MLLAFYRSVNRASACASATVDALFRIDHVLVITSSDSFYRTFFDACSTVDAFVLNYISHSYYLLIDFVKR